MRLGPILLCLGALVLFDCATLDPLPGGTCGNGVVDPGEDCDTYAPSKFSSGKCGGASEGASACHLKCTSTSDCPDGWGCSVGGICRAPSGDFARLGDPVSAGVVTLDVGDFDGDGRKDVIGSGPKAIDHSAKVRLHYFGDGAALAFVNAMSAPIVTPSVRDFDGDGLDDFACGIPTFGAFGMFVGQKDRSMVPVIFPSFRQPNADAKPVILLGQQNMLLPSGKIGSFLLAGKLRSPTGQTVTALWSPFDSRYMQPIPDVQEILGDPVWWPIRDWNTADSMCGEITVAMKDGTPNGSIQIFSPCRRRLVGTQTTMAWAPDRAPIVIKPKAPLDGGIQIADIDGDTHDDILFSTKDASGATTVWIARGTGTQFLDPEATGLPQFPIATGDLDGDGRIDFVFRSVIYVSSPSPAATPPPNLDAGAEGGVDASGGGGGGGAGQLASYRFIDTGRRPQWTTAHIGDFNGDKVPDLVAASSDEPDIDVVSGSKDGLFVTSTIATSGPVPRLTTGDFDGDGLVDVAFLQTRPGSTDHDIAIAYARLRATPEAPRVVGRTKNVLNLDAIGIQPPVDGIGLFIREDAPNPGDLPNLAFAIIAGNGDRQPVAPLILDDAKAGPKDPDPDIVRLWEPLEVFADKVLDANRTDLYALAAGYRFSQSTQTLVGPFPAKVWVAAGQGGTAFDTPIVTPQDIGQFDLRKDGSVSFDARIATGDLDTPRDGRKEVVVIFSDPSGAFTVQVQPPRDNKPPAAINIPSGLAFRSDAPVVLADADADGALDLLTIVGSDDKAEVVVFWNDLKGSFLPDPDHVPMPPAADGTSDPARGIASITVAGANVDGDGGARREIAVATKTSLYLLRTKGGDRTSLDLHGVSLGPGAKFGSATAVAAGDFDGDGVEDLAIADGGSLRILRQVPR